MDDSLHETTHVRHDLPGPPKALPWQPTGNPYNSLKGAKTPARKAQANLRKMVAKEKGRCSG